MKRIFIISLILSSCTANVLVENPPGSFIETENQDLKNENGTWMFKHKKLDGYIIEKKNSRVIAMIPVVAGKENGKAYGWYPNGKKKYERNFIKGNREGIQRGWHENDSLSFLYFFYDDKYEGEQRTYFENGKLWQVLNYKNGYEEGKQKSWNKSGRLINNFTVKNGKLYGVIGRFDCMSVMEK